jgi:hypothetical protein
MGSWKMHVDLIFFLCGNHNTDLERKALILPTKKRKEAQVRESKREETVE